MTRLHPFGLVFGEMSETRFPEIRAAGDAESRDRRLFLQLAPVQGLLADLAPAEDTPLRAALMEEYGSLLYAGYRFWAGGAVTLDVAIADIDGAASSPLTERPPEVPHNACYLRFPERCLWSQIALDAPHEPLDGVFVVSGPDAAELTVLAVLGLWAERGGFSQIAVSVPAADFPRAGSARRHSLFAPVMAGGERAEFRSIVTEGELLHLTHLALIAVGR